MDVVVGRRHTVDQKLRYLFINLTVTRKYWHHRQPIFFPSYYGSWGILELFRQTKISILVCCAPHDQTNWTTIAKMPMTWHGGCIKKAFQMTLLIWITYVKLILLCYLYQFQKLDFSYHLKFLNQNFNLGLLCTARPNQLDDHCVNAHDLTRGLYEQGYSHDPSHLKYGYR